MKFSPHTNPCVKIVPVFRVFLVLEVDVISNSLLSTVVLVLRDSG